MTTSTKFSWPDGHSAALSLSFDDARLTQTEKGTAILDTYGVKATFYVLEPAVQQRLDGWRKAVEAGHEIGNHTQTHPCSGNFTFAREKALENYTLEKIAQEMDTANLAIEHTLGVKPTTFAYPCGQTFVGRGRNVQSYVPVVAEKFLAGRVYKSEYHNAPEICDLAQLYGVDFDELTFTQAMTRIETALKEGGWLIFGGHEIAENRSQGVLPETLEALCKWIRATDTGLWVDTVANIATHIKSQRDA